jgi:hypothetical protein
MAVRRVQLHHRIKGQAANQAAVMEGSHPSAATVSGLTVMPVAVVSVNPGIPGYATLAMSELTPIITADGAVIPATMPGRWDQLYQAGRT